MTTPDCGRFVWYELMTSDPKGGLDFYTQLVGWQPQSFGGYTMLVGTQGPLAGVQPLPEQARAMGAPPHWIGSVTVPDAEALVAKVRELGGKVLVEPNDMPEVGRLAVIADPQGAVIAVIAPFTDMKSHDATKPGEFRWRELVTSDHAAAFGFYSAIFGWEQLGAHDMGPMGTYLLYGREGEQLGGMFTLPASMPQPPSWVYYIHVADIDASVAKATALGAQVLMGVHAVPTGERIAQLRDPHGAVFALHGDAQPAA